MLKFQIFIISGLLYIVSIAQGHANGLLRVTECANPKGAFYDLHSNDKKWDYDDSVKMSVSILTEHEGVHDIAIKDGVKERPQLEKAFATHGKKAAEIVLDLGHKEDA